MEQEWHRVVKESARRLHDISARDMNIPVLVRSADAEPQSVLI